MDTESKVQKVESALTKLKAEIADSKVVKAIEDFIETAEDKSKALLHDLLHSGSSDDTAAAADDPVADVEPTEAAPAATSDTAATEAASAATTGDA